MRLRHPNNPPLSTVSVFPAAGVRPSRSPQRAVSRRLFRSLRSQAPRPTRPFRCAQRERLLSTRRTLRKPTRWTPEEWAQIEESARRCDVPPARYVREAALGRAPPERSHPVPRATDDRVRGNALLNQLSRVLSNLRQLTRVAEIDGDTAASEVLAASTRTVEDAAARAPTAIDQDADTALATLIEAGIALNALARRANGMEQVPANEELRPVLLDVLSAVGAIVP